MDQSCKTCRMIRIPTRKVFFESLQKENHQQLKAFSQVEQSLQIDPKIVLCQLQTPEFHHLHFT